MNFVSGIDEMSRTRYIFELNYLESRSKIFKKWFILKVKILLLANVIRIFLNDVDAEESQPSMYQHYGDPS